MSPVTFVRRCSLVLRLLVAAGLGGVVDTAAAPAGATRPNIVLINIDDLGYSSTSPFGAPKTQTPRLDRMAAEGRIFTSFYAAAPLCSPARAALMTGSYPRRVGLGRGSGHSVLFPADTVALHPSEITVAEVLRKAGYATGCFGKWHLGDQPGFLPTDQGFDAYYGILYSNDMWPAHPGGWQFPLLPLMRGSAVIGEVRTMQDQAELCRLFTDEATAFIRANRTRPFFLYLPHAFVHGPRAARQEFTASDDVLKAQIREVDWSVGRLLDTLAEVGVAEKTLVLFTSDNGGAGPVNNVPLRGGKGSAFEGGQRVPLIAHWPGVIPPGTVCDELATQMDLMPTLADLTGGSVPTDRVLDGRNIRALLTGAPGARSPHAAFFYHQENTLRAVRAGPWKLFVSGELYDLKNDIGEVKDVAGAHPDLVADLRRRLSDFEAEIAANSRPAGRPVNPRTILPRPGAEGAEAHRPTLDLPKVPR
ncbi:MAG: sulfatase [Opitutaceae bacterium]|nr:sulfatase [Opitutaceae bacterium]